MTFSLYYVIELGELGFRTGTLDINIDHLLNIPSLVFDFKELLYSDENIFLQ